jgi:hypothetical protein
VRHLFLAIALFGTGLLPAHAIDLPAQIVTGKRSIEALPWRTTGLTPEIRPALHGAAVVGGHSG